MRCAEMFERRREEMRVLSTEKKRGRRGNESAINREKERKERK